jgi:2,3-bisphosphoglycerate-dependent phosphoglycerate mutase
VSGLPTRRSGAATHSPAMHALVFMRHGATEPNLAGLRCGGDLDVPLTELGRRQAADAARLLIASGVPVGVIVTSALQRTVETAEIVSRLLGGVPVQVDAHFAERHLGELNLQPIAETEARLMQGNAPPGGESRDAFARRIAATLPTLLALRGRHPLLVGSKGVARVLRELIGLPNGAAPANGEIVAFDLAPLAHRMTERCTA